MPRFLIILVWLMFCSWPVGADQQVPLGTSGSQQEILQAAFEQAITQEIELILGISLPEQRQKLIMSVLKSEQDSFIAGYSEQKTALEDDQEPKKILVVRLSTATLRKRLQELGVLATVHNPLPYVLTLSHVQPSETKDLGPLQELSGLIPQTMTHDPLIPELKLSRPGGWLGVLSWGDAQVSHGAKTLEELWLALWKDYFSKQSSGLTPDNEVRVRIVGWLSGQGPLDFDQLLETWSAEVDQKSLVAVDMDGPAIAATWKIQTRSKALLMDKLHNAVRAQGLILESL